MMSFPFLHDRHQHDSFRGGGGLLAPFLWLFVSEVSSPVIREGVTDASIHGTLMG